MDRRRQFGAPAVLAAALAAAACNATIPRNRATGLLVPDLPPARDRVQVTAIPLPAVSSHPNEGVSIGTLPVVLFRDDEKIASIFAPSVTENRLVGTTGTLRLLGFVAPGEEYHLEWSQSTVGAHDDFVQYDHRALGGSALGLSIRGEYLEDPTYRFFGLGPSSRRSDETDYTHLEAGGHMTLSRRLRGQWSAELTERFRRVKVGPGIVDEVPDSVVAFAAIPGMRGKSSVWAHRASLVYDSRDSERVPTRGGFARGFYEVSDPQLGSETFFHRVGGEVKRLWPAAGGRLVTVARAWGEVLDGSRVPFFERGLFGGSRSLRGADVNRFVENSLLVFNLEERLRLAEVEIMDVRTEVQWALYTDFGRVYSTEERFRFSNFQFVGGFGVRLVVPPWIVGKIDVGLGEDGASTFVEMGYPF
ncbi:MAG: BamA/TamA family outer membrane protein [Planctomycetes bacterium]|nr:BamA/TamA family outer membrane protein [Planctomycetota bacterium]